MPTTPPFIHFEVLIPASDYSLLLDNIRGGDNAFVGHSRIAGLSRQRVAPRIWLGRRDDVLAQCRKTRVDVESIVFQYQLIGEDETDDVVVKPPTAKASIDAASDAIVSRLADLENAFEKGIGIIVTVIIIACAVLYFARH